MIYRFHSYDFEKALRWITEKVSGNNCAYVLELKKARNKRSVPQNKYYWSVVVGLVAEHTGYSSQEAHQELAWLFLSYAHEVTGKRFVKSTTELNTVEFEKYVEQCRIWAQTELDIRIPLPNEIDEETWMRIQEAYN